MAKSVWKATSRRRTLLAGTAGAHLGQASVEQPLARPHQQFGQDGLLAGEIAIDRRPADADRGAQVLDRDRVEPTIGEEPSGGIEELLASLGLVPAALCLLFHAGVASLQLWVARFGGRPQGRTCYRISVRDD